MCGGEGGMEVGGGRVMEVGCEKVMVAAVGKTTG